MSFTAYFLTPKEVVEIHDNMVSEYDGDAGVRDYNLIESTIAASRQTLDGAFLNKWPFEMAAAIFVGLANNHAFIDGNKRTASFSTYAFLFKNGYKMTFSDNELVELTLAVVEKKHSKAALAEILEANCTFVGVTKT